MSSINAADRLVMRNNACLVIIVVMSIRYEKFVVSMLSGCAITMPLHYFLNAWGLRARGYFGKRIVILCVNRSEESVPYERVKTEVLRSKFVVHIVADRGIDPSPDRMR